MKSIQEISIVGLGFVGKAFARHFLSRGLKIKQIVVRKNQKEPLNGVAFIQDLSHLQPVDLVLVCVNDAALEQVISQIPNDQLIAYTSGAIGLNQFPKHQNISVFYPLQSFAKLKAEAVAEIPILLEAHDAATLNQLRDFALRNFKVCREMNSEQRAQLHLAAVFANNFTNHLIHLAQKHCAENNLDFDLLKPLVMETAKKWMNHNAVNLQTGPAIRGDQNVIEKHLNQLEGNEKSIYEVLTRSIQDRDQMKEL